MSRNLLQNSLLLRVNKAKPVIIDNCRRICFLNAFLDDFKFQTLSRNIFLFFRGISKQLAFTILQITGSKRNNILYAFKFCFHI